MSLILIGTNYKYSDLKTREKLSFSKDDLSLALRALTEEGIATGAVILSTCQRVELYADTEDAGAVKRFLFNFKEYSLPDEYLYIKENAGAIHHLFTVASGLDSQVVGELEILHQVKEALLKARQLKATTALLNRVFERTLFAGRTVRRESGIADTPPSIASVAVKAAEETVGFENKNIFVIGAGLIAEKVAQICASKGKGCVIVANRTFEKADRLARRIGAKAITFKEFYERLGEIDILFSATASRHLILKKDLFDKNRPASKRIVIFDLAFPRDIDPAISNKENVILFNLDDFKERQVFRSKEISRAKELVREKAARFLEKEDNRWKLELAQGQALWR